MLIDSANSLDNNLYEVTIISLSLFDADKTMLNVVGVNSNIRIFYFNYVFFNDYSLLGYLKLFFKNKKSYSDIDKIIKVIDEIKPDIIHFHTSPRELLIKRFFKVNAKYVYTDHLLRINKNDYGVVKSKILSIIFRRLYSGYYVIAVSKEIEKSLYKNKIINTNKKITTILNGVNVDLFNIVDSHIDFDKLNAIYVSRIETIKGHEDLIKAWALLPDINNKHLYLVGPDGLNGKIQALTKELNCEDSVTFTGPFSNPRDLLAKSNIAIFPSYKEGLPLALLEKMAMGLPIIVSNIDELTSIITNEKNGIVFKLGDVVDLSEKIRFVYFNKFLAEVIGKNARKTVELNYNFKDNISKLEIFYDTILN